MSTYSIYFSPTGGTKKIADGISKSIDENFISLELEKIDSEKKFTISDLVIVTIPCFSGRMPEYCSDKLKLISGNDAKAVIISSYGNREFDDQLVEMEDLLTSLGFKVVAAGGFISQHSLTEKIGTGRPDVEDEKDFATFAKELMGKLETGIDEKLNIPGNRPYKELANSSAIPYGDDSCIYCMACVEGCPVKAITEDNPIDTDDKLCFACQRCVAICPVECRKIDPKITEMVTKRLLELAGNRKPNRWFI